MPPTKTPTSSLTATELLAKRVWYRTLARIWRLSSRGSSPTTRPSCFARLSADILEIIVTHLIYDTCSLRACSLTCYSLYIAVVPHLHHTHIAQAYSLDTVSKHVWASPLWNMRKLGLLPLVQKFHIRGIDVPDPSITTFDSCVFSPELFSYSILRHFTALTNVQELGIDYLDLPSFFPRIQQYFGHFSSTVHSLALREPIGSRRQIIYFIGMFEHLEDLKLLYEHVGSQGEPVDDSTLIPVFVPPLRGRLTVTSLMKVGIFKDMIDLFGGIRFRYMELYNVAGMRLLLDACAETLETLRLYPTDPRGISSIRDFDLSRNKCIRSLEARGRDIDDALFRGGPPAVDVAARIFRYVLSTITSPAFTKVTIFYEEYDFSGVGRPWINCPILYMLPASEMVKEDIRFSQRLEVFRTMSKVRDFQLVWCADVWDRVGEYTVGVLKYAVRDERLKGGFDTTFREPLVTYSPRGSRAQKMESLNNTPVPWIPL